MALAKEVHGGLVPEVTSHWDVEGANPPLNIYSIPYLRGSALVEVQSVEFHVSDEEEGKYGLLIRRLAQ